MVAFGLERLLELTLPVSLIPEEVLPVVPVTCISRLQGRYALPSWVNTSIQRDQLIGKHLLGRDKQ